MASPDDVRQIAMEFEGAREADPKAFVKHMWGKTPELLVQLEHIEAAELRNLIKEAIDAAQPPLKKRKPGAKRVSSRANR